jgi:hypothetical protein
MRLRERYRRLTLWNRISFWGSVTSFVGLAIAFWTFRPSTVPSSRLTLADLSVIDSTTLDVKLKNSGSDAAFITGIRVHIESVTRSGGCGDPGCMMMLVGPSGVYTYDLTAVIEGSEYHVRPSPNVKPDTSLARLFAGAEATGPVMRLSHVVLPRNVERFLISCALPERFRTIDLYGSGVGVFIGGYLIIIYDGGKELRTSHFTLFFPAVRSGFEYEKPRKFNPAYKG